MRMQQRVLSLARCTVDCEEARSKIGGSAGYIGIG
jgi:hypothetical protein